MFLGEDYNILLPSGNVSVTFKPSIWPAQEIELIKYEGEISPRVKLNDAHTHLILKKVVETDEGVYIIKSRQNPDDVRQLNLIVRGDTQLGLITFFHCFLSQWMLCPSLLIFIALHFVEN